MWGHHCTTLLQNLGRSTPSERGHGSFLAGRRLALGGEVCVSCATIVDERTRAIPVLYAGEGARSTYPLCAYTCGRNIAFGPAFCCVVPSCGVRHDRHPLVTTAREDRDLRDLENVRPEALPAEESRKSWRMGNVDGSHQVR